jgi:hypothetical protein
MMKFSCFGQHLLISKKKLLAVSLFLGGASFGKGKYDSVCELCIYSPYNHHQTLHEMHLKMQADKFYEHKIVCLQQKQRLTG